MQPNRPAPSKTLLSTIRTAAKALARAGKMTHAQGLDTVARQHGWPSWHEIQKAAASTATAQAAPAPMSDLPVDPALPPGFDDTPNEERSTEEVDLWWDRPFALSLPGGGYLVRCLDGGAWDRSSNYGQAPDLPSARELAQDKLARWQKMRDRPSLLLDEGHFVVRMPSRPGREIEVLYEAKDAADAARFIQFLEDGAAPGAPAPSA